MEQKDLFTKVYREDIWRIVPGAPKSGPGSSIEFTKNIVRELPVLFRDFNIYTVLDIPCGDFTWFSQVDRSNIDYVGADIVPDIIQDNLRAYPTIPFVEMDLINSMLPAFDLILCRDCLFHFQEKNIFRALKNIKNSGSRYLLTTTHTWRSFPNVVGTDNWTTDNVFFHKLNLMLPPYNLPPPLLVIPEGNNEPNAEDRVLALWECSSLP